MPQFPYQFFENFVVRTPLLSCKDFQEIFSEQSTNDERIKKLLTHDTFREAIYLASPFLFQEIEKWLSGKVLSKKDQDKLKNTILKYYSRISTRSTPFGLFSGVGLGRFDSVQYDKLKTNNHQPITVNRIRDTKLDMHFLVSLSKHFEKIPEIKNKLLFFPNNSIYKVGTKIRYVEYEFTGGKRDYIISSAPLSEELELILNFSQSGKTIEQIAENLINSEIEDSPALWRQITKEDATEFIEELIDNQVLVSEIEPNVSGGDFLNTLIFVLKRIVAKKETDTLISVRKKLDELDETIGNPISKYEEIENLIKSLSTDYDQKYLFQTDLYYKNEFKLSYDWKKKLKKGISFLNKITLLDKETHLEKFKQAFHERFETEEVPLTLALDTEIGIGYKQNTSAKGVHSYLEDLTIPRSKEEPTLNLKLDPVRQILNEKLQEALLGNQYCVELTDEDFKNFEENWQNLSETMSFMTEIISENGKGKLFLNGGNNNAGRLLGRFCSDKSEIKNLTKTIAEKEDELHPNVILAEIIHLPEARIGNIIRRPTLRSYEIPYLAKSILPLENQIPADDLYISLKNDKIVLRSKKLDKEIKPYLTNAHNHYSNSLPIYHFLYDLNSQNKRTGLYFSWGDLEQIYHFFPRVEYQNIILSKAQWKISENEIKRFLLLVDDKQNLINEIKNWQNKKRIPKWIQWVKSDHTLTVNLENYNLIKMWIDAVKNEKQIIIEEFLFDENDGFKNEFIFPIYKNN